MKIFWKLITRPDLRGKTESEANVEQNEEDERRQFLPKLMIIRFVGEFVSVLQYSRGVRREVRGPGYRSPS